MFRTTETASYNIWTQSFAHYSFKNYSSGNAIHAANTPVMDEMSTGDKALTLNASGLAVGLPDGLSLY